VGKSGANLAALEALNTERGKPIKVRQNRYLNNVVEQDHRAVKRIVKPMTGFNSFRCVRIILSGIELMHMIRRTDAGRARYQNCGQAVLFAVHVSIPIHNRLHAYHLWTRNLVRELVRQRFGVTLSLASIGAMLARLNLTPQKPLQRAYQRDPEAIERWQRDTYPSIAKKAREQKADIFFWDESGFRADSVHGRTWAPRGETPVVERPGERQSMSAASAVNSKGAFWFATYERALSGELFVELLKKLMFNRKRAVHLIVDGLPA
jgi:transposase-like protein